jgi:hypothetical protein
MQREQIDEKSYSRIIGVMLKNKGNTYCHQDYLLFAWLLYEIFEV